MKQTTRDIPDADMSARVGGRPLSSDAPLLVDFVALADLPRLAEIGARGQDDVDLTAWHQQSPDSDATALRG